MKLMSRSTVSLGIALVLLVGIVGFVALRSTPATALQATSESLAGHPVVGAWIVSGQDGIPSVSGWSSDGIITENEQDGSGGHGTWEADGESAARFTLIILVPDPETPYTLTARGRFDVDGDTGTITVSITGVGVDGTVLFAADATLNATRIPIEPAELKGTPVAVYPTVAASPAP